MRRLMIAFCAFLSLAGPLAAEDSNKLEIGTSLGLAYTFFDNATVTSFGIPGAGTFLGLASLYLTTFPHPNVMFEPQVQVQVRTSEGSSNSLLSGLLQVGYLFTPTNPGSFYFAAHFGGMFADSGSSDTRPALGFGAGYRWEIGPGGALRLEARYRRWFDESEDLDELAFTLGLGGLFQ